MIKTFDDYIIFKVNTATTFIFFIKDTLTLDFRVKLIMTAVKLDTAISCMYEFPIVFYNFCSAASNNWFWPPDDFRIKIHNYVLFIGVGEQFMREQLSIIIVVDEQFTSEQLSREQSSPDQFSATN